MDFGCILSKSDGFVERNIGDEKVIVPITNNIVDMNCVYTMNEVGAFVYNAIDGIKSLGEIYESLLEEFEVTPCIAEPDLEKFVDESLKKGLLFTQK